MSFFEYAMIPVSMLLAVAVARLLEGLYDAVTSDAWYGVHLVYVVVVGVNVLQFLDGAWSRAQAIEATQTIPFFAVLVGSAVPAILVLQAYSLTTARPSSITDWRAHFYHVRRPFFFLNGLRGLFLVATYVVFTERDLATEEVVPLLVVVAYSTIGFLTASPRAQALLAGLAAASTLVFISGRLESVA